MLVHVLRQLLQSQLLTRRVVLPGSASWWGSWRCEHLVQLRGTNCRPLTICTQLPVCLCCTLHQTQVMLRYSCHPEHLTPPAFPQPGKNRCRLLFRIGDTLSTRCGYFRRCGRGEGQIRCLSRDCRCTTWMQRIMVRSLESFHVVTLVEFVLVDGLQMCGCCCHQRYSTLNVALAVCCSQAARVAF